MDPVFLKERIEQTKMLITAYEDAALAVGVNGGVQSYSLDTSQSKQTVTRADIPSLHRIIDSLYNRLAILEMRLYGGSVTIARPSF